MADQNITALPVTTSPASSDQLLVVGATEEKLIDYEKLADAILTKLTSKTFALDQGTKTLVTALNELNSNFNTEWQNGNGKSIFDIFTPGGTYGIYSYYNIADIPNLEVTYVGIIKWNERMLVITEENIYFTSSSQNVWKKKWYKISSTLVS